MPPLILPLAAANGTTIAMFIPMLLAEGLTAEFTRSLPLVVTIALSVSLVFALTITPLLCARFLRPRPSQASDARIRRLAKGLGKLAIRRPTVTMVMAGAGVAMAALGMATIDQEFFPPADRQEFVISLHNEVGTHMDAVDEAARRVESLLAEEPDVEVSSTFVGRTVPSFYYNMLPSITAPHRADILVRANRQSAVASLSERIRYRAAAMLPDTVVVAKPVSQGPARPAAISVRIANPNIEELDEASRVVRRAMMAQGLVGVRDDLGGGAGGIRVHVDDAAAARLGISRHDVGTALLAMSRGVTVGNLRRDGEVLPIDVRTRRSAALSVDEILSAHVATRGAGSPVPISQVATSDVQWRPAAVHRYNRQRVAVVNAEVPAGRFAHASANSLMNALDQLPLANVELDITGSTEAATEANLAILRVFPVGAVILLMILIMEFNSFRKVGIILLTIPLAAIGIVPGLLLSGLPFGFMSVLGAMALIGIVVNNAIVLLDAVGTLQGHGMATREALQEAVRERARPIVLTALTTIVGMLPLALSGASLWPPFAWSVMSGLATSTVLTLLVVPAAYLLTDSREARA